MIFQESLPHFEAEILSWLAFRNLPKCMIDLPNLPFFPENPGRIWKSGSGLDNYIITIQITISELLRPYSPLLEPIRSFFLH